MKITLEQLRRSGLKLSALGLAMEGEMPLYYCTPRDADIFGSAGVDGIHYCTVPGFGEMIFAVSPMNFGDCVHPIARDVEELLRLLLACGDMAAVEQCYGWDGEQFRAFLLDNPPTEEQKAVLEALGRTFSLEPEEDPFHCIQSLQRDFDLSQIPYTDDYYDLDMNPAAPPRPQPWQVTFSGNYWGASGEPGEELSVERHFVWGGQRWYVPAVYLCPEGIVVEYLLEEEPERVRAFLDKWQPREQSGQLSREERRQLEEENPLSPRFHSSLLCDGETLKQKRGCGGSWLTESCLDAGVRNEPELSAVVEHYGLSRERCWGMYRVAYPRAKQSRPGALSVTLCREERRTPGPRFVTPAAGESLVLTHPRTGQSYVLTVRETEAQTMDLSFLPDAAVEYPSHMLCMCYTLEPDAQERVLRIEDCLENDPPRPKPGRPAPDGPSAIGIIGGASRPTALGEPEEPRRHVVFSALHFTPAEQVQWQVRFFDRPVEEITEELL